MNEPPVNLNQWRKSKTRAKAKARADENAVSHGRTKAQKTLESARAEKAARTAEAHKREP